MKLSIPELSLVVLIGTSGSGKSTFARRHFKPTEVLSSDYFRGLVSDDDNDQTVSTPAFEVLHYVAARFGYAVRLAPVGPEDPDIGPATQMGVFERTTVRS